MPFDLPSGAGLRDKICNIVNNPEYSTQDRAFAKRFLYSGSPSIDRWIMLHPEDRMLVNWGQRMIAEFIMGPEAWAAQSRTLYENWQGWVFHRWFQGSFDHAPQLRFVTFNYDRLIEVAMFNMLKSCPSCTNEIAQQRLQSLVRVVHVHGTPESDLIWTSVKADLVCSYTRSDYIQAANGIRLIRPTTDTVRAHQEARQILESAQTVIFLGFAFDEENLRAIGLHRDNYDDSLNLRGYTTCKDVAWARRSEWQNVCGLHLQQCDRNYDSLNFLNQYVRFTK